MKKALGFHCILEDEVLSHTLGYAPEDCLAVEGSVLEAHSGASSVEWNGICFSGQRPSTGTGKVIQRLRREKRNKIE